MLPIQAHGAVPLPASALINGGFDVWQRQAPATPTARADDAYGPDRWYVLTQTAAVNVERSAGDTQSKYAGKLTQNQAAAQRMGLAQIVESFNAIPYRGRSVIFPIRVKCSSSQAIRIAILEWTGTADTVVSDVVNDWTNGTFTAGQFFKSTTMVVSAVSVITPGAAAWTALNLTAAVSTSANNIIVFVWTEGTAAQNVTLELTQAGFYAGTALPPWLPRPIMQELGLCKRYYEVLGGANTDIGMAGYGGISTTAWNTFAYQAEKRTSPTVTKSGTWAVSNCSQPSVVSLAGAINTFVLETVVTALASFFTYTNSADDVITAEAEL